MKRSKLQDVADLAGVSIGTASRVLNHKPNVMPETRDRVLAAAEKLAYYPARQSLLDVPATQATIGVLATLVPDEYVISNPFYGNVIAGIDRECREQQIKLVYASFNRAVHATPASWPLPLYDTEVDGLILTGHIRPHVVDQVYEQTGKPIVLVDTDAPAFDAILIDNVVGGYHAVRYLIEQGHRHIALVGTQTGAVYSFEERRKGYLRALADYGISKTYIGESSHLIHEIYDAAKALLQQNPSITAVFVCLDLGASAVIQAARDLGKDVPGDVSVIGFDNLALAAHTMPPLTTMHIDIPLMGVWGVRQLLERMDYPKRVATKILLRPQLVIRDSVRQVSAT